MTLPSHEPAPHLPPGHVHVWRLSLAVEGAALSALEGVLSPDERQRAARFAFPELRRRFVVGRAGLRRLLGRYLDRAAEGLRFTYGPAGKPELAGGGLQFNVAHSAEQALLAVAAAAPAGNGQRSDLDGIGIDLELVRPLDVEATARSVFPPAELQALAEARPEDKTDTFFRLWVRHEAQIKALGLGLGAEAQVPVYDLDVGPEYRAALAVVAGAIHIDVFHA